MVVDRKIYPIISTRTWWDLRKAFGRSLPGEVSPRYLATVLGIQERAAANIVPNLRRVGLIHEDGAPTERAVLWRDDAHYADACTAILSESYPQQLTDAAPPPSPDRERVTGWFARETRTGSAASSQMARLYLLLAKADATDSEQSETSSGGALPTRPAAAGKPSTKGVTRATPPPSLELSPRRTDPSVHIDIQVHIDASASGEQIDQIFASMSKHLYGRG